MVSLVIVGKYDKMKQFVRNWAKNPVMPIDSLTNPSYPSTAVINTVHEDLQTKSPKTMVQIATAVKMDGKYYLSVFCCSSDADLIVHAFTSFSML